MFLLDLAVMYRVRRTRKSPSPSEDIPSSASAVSTRPSFSMLSADGSPILSHRSSVTGGGGGGGTSYMYNRSNQVSVCILNVDQSVRVASSSLH